MILGAGVIIGPNVSVGTNVNIGHYSIIEGNVKIGDNVKIHPGVVIGGPPQYKNFKPDPTGKIHIGHGSELREYCTINMPTVPEGCTVVGANCYIMNHVNISHDVKIGNNVTVSNGASIGGFCHIGDYCNLGFNCSIHQHVHLGAGCMIGMNSQVRKNVFPFTTIKNNKTGFNLIGAQRFSKETNIDVKLLAQCFFEQENISELCKNNKKLLKYYSNFCEK